MAETTIVPENLSVSLSNNKNHDSNSNISDNSQFKVESTSTFNNNIEPSKTPIQTNHSISNKISDDMSTTMSKLSMDDMRTTNYSNSNHFRQNSSYQYHNQIPTPSHLTPHINPPEAQAQLVAFTQPLMSVQVPYQDSRMYQRNYHSTKSYVQNQQPSLSMKSKSETAGAQPEYYMDSFAPNFSDKPSSNSDNTNKTKTKHVTFQEPDVTNEPSKSNSNNPNFPQPSSNGSNYSSSTWAPPIPMHPNPRSWNRYNYSNYYYPHNEFYSSYHNMTMHPLYMTHPRRMNMMPTPPVWPSYSYYPNQQTPYIPHLSQPRQLYDPKKPKISLTSESHDSSRVIRHIAPKNKKKTKQTNNTDNSTVSTAESIPHPITILRKPSTDTEVTAPPVENQPVFSPAAEKEEEQQQPINSSNAPSEEQQLTSSSNAPSEEQQLTSSSNAPSEEQQPTSSSNAPSEEQQPTSSSNALSEEQQPTSSSNDPSEEEPTITSSIADQSESNPTISLLSHELLSILQSAKCTLSLNDYAQQKKFPVNYEFSSISPSSFTCIISINGRSFPASSPCSSKNEAQKLACDQALRILYRESCSNEQSSLEFSSKHDYIAHRSISTFQELNVNELLLGRKTLACILMITNQQFEQARVISIATGNGCLDETNLSYADDGTALHDCHAEILARRGLIKYFFQQIKQSKDNKSSIFKYNSTINKYDLDENITFHMYISSLPCGNASLKISSNSIRYKQGQTEGTLLASTSTIKSPIKSCSDKICRWNILGIQGGLLINFLTKPIYLQTITIACETTFDRNHVKSSLCEHLKEYFPSLPSPFLFHIPNIDCPKMKSFQQERQVAKLQTNAFAWNITQPDRTELLEPMTGRLKNDRSISSLSKQNLFEDFLNIHQDNSLTYQQAKQLNKTYVLVKNLISTAFQTESSDKNVSWLSKSDELEQFSIQ